MSFKNFPFEKIRFPFDGIFYPIDGSDVYALFNLSKEYESYLEERIKTHRDMLELIPKSNEVLFKFYDKSILRHEGKLVKIRKAKEITTDYLHRNKLAIPGSPEDIEGKEMYKRYLANIKQKAAEEFPIPNKNIKVVKHKQKTLDQYNFIRKLFDDLTRNMHLSVKDALNRIARKLDLSPSYIKDIVYKPF